LIANGLLSTATLACAPIVEKPPGQDHQPAHVLILRRDAQQHGVLGDAAADADAVVVLQHGRVGNDAGH
jgi:hypothetical protein